MSNWDLADLDLVVEHRKWEKEAQAFQQSMFLRLGDREWDEWNISDETILQRKVGFGLYTLTEYLPDANNLGYNEEQFNNIKLVTGAILENANISNKTIQFACIFVFGKTSEKLFHIPVFKVKGKEQKTLFVDSDCLVYENWQDYLDSNRLPRCWYCYPSDGLYQGDNDGQVLVKFRISSGGDSDSTARVVNFAPTTVMEASSSTVPRTTSIPAAVQGTSTETGVTTRSVTNLVDQQWCDPLSGDLKEIMDMLGIFSTVLNKAQSVMRANITRSAATGDIANLALCIAYNVVTVGSLTANGLGILCDLIELVDKVDEDSLTDNDVFQFLGSVLFFSNSLLQSNTAREIIQNTQNQVLNQYCYNLTSSQIEELCNLLHQVKGNSQLHENANKIKAINKIVDKETFFESLVTARNDLKGHQVQFSLEEPGLVNIDNELHIAPNKLVEMSEIERLVILAATQKVKNSDMNDTAHWKTIEKILEKNRVKMQYQRREAIAQLKKAFQTENLAEVKIGDENILKNIKSYELDRLANMMKSTFKNFDPNVLNIVNAFAKMRNCKNVFDYCSYVEFAVKHLQHLEKQREADFREEFDEEKKRNKTAKINEFMKKKGIEGKISDYCWKEVFNNFDEKSLKYLDQLYTYQENEVRPVNAQSTPNFASVPAAVYHYFKHCDFGGEELTPQQYFGIAEDLVNEPIHLKKAQLTQQGNKMMIIFENPIIGATAVVYKTLVDETLSLATLLYENKDKKKLKKQKIVAYGN